MKFITVVLIFMFISACGNKKPTYPLIKDLDSFYKDAIDQKKKKK